MRRVHLRGHDNILKRVLLQAGALNLGLLLRTLCGVGTPRALQGRFSVLLACAWSFISLPATIWTHIWTLFRPSALPECSRGRRDVRDLIIAAATPFTTGC